MTIVTPFQALIGHLELMDDNNVNYQRSVAQKQGGNQSQHPFFSNNGMSDAADVWAAAMPMLWDTSSQQYSSTTDFAAPLPGSMRGGMAEEYHDHSGHGHYFHQNQVFSRPGTAGIYEDKCDSPECHVPECSEPDCVEEVVQCTDPACLDQEAEICHEPELCISGGHTKCAGPLEFDVISAAASLAAMKPAQTNHQGQFMNLMGHFAPPSAYDQCVALSGGANPYIDSRNHPQHYGPCLYANAYMPSQPQAFDFSLCRYVSTATNYCQSHETYHTSMPPPSFQNSTLQYAMSLRDLSSRASSSQDPFSFSNSNSEQTPSSASTYSSPHNRTRDLNTPLQTPLTGMPLDSSPLPICQWQDSPNSPPCNLQCPSKAALQAHIQSTHTAPLSKSLGFICRWSGCSRLTLPSARSGFAQRSKLDRHMQSHTGHKACKCPLCHHEFSTSQTLESHMRTHTGDKPFKCREPDCGYEAAQASQLTMHTRTKHTREKPLVCDEPGCGRRFAESSNLSKHRKIHEPEEECRCNVCGKGFRRRDQLRRHGKIHMRKDGTAQSGANSVDSTPRMSSVILPPGTSRSFEALPRRAIGGGQSGATSGAPTIYGDEDDVMSPTDSSADPEVRDSGLGSSGSGEVDEDEIEGAQVMMRMTKPEMSDIRGGNYAAAPRMVAVGGGIAGGLEGMD